MGRIDALAAGMVIGLDEAPLISYVEEHPHYLPLVEPLFNALDDGVLRAVASTVVLLEVLVVPLRNGDNRTAQTYRDILLNSDAITLSAVSPDIAERAAHLRARYQVKAPDALHLATALHAGATHYITNDLRLPMLAELQVIALDRLAGDVA